MFSSMVSADSACEIMKMSIAEVRNKEDESLVRREGSGYFLVYFLFLSALFFLLGGYMRVVSFLFLSD